MKLELPHTPQILFSFLSFPQLSAAEWQKLPVTHWTWEVLGMHGPTGLSALCPNSDTPHIY